MVFGGVNSNLEASLSRVVWPKLANKRTFKGVNSKNNAPMFDIQALV